MSKNEPSWSPKRSNRAGGAAAAGGMDFQHRVAAWVATRILAEREASPPWSLPAGMTLDWLRCETEQPVDDLMVGTSDNGMVLCQVKHSLHLSSSPESDLALTLDQFVRQFIAYRHRSPGEQLWERELDPTRDRLVIATGPNSSSSISVHLPLVLKRLKRLGPDQSKQNAASNNREKRALSTVTNHIVRLWNKALGIIPSDDEINQLLSLIEVQVLDVDNGCAQEREAKDLLRNVVLHDPQQVDAAWALLISYCAQLSSGRSGAARLNLQQVLISSRIDIRAPQSFQGDIAQLKSQSQRIVRLVADLSHIRVGQTEVKINRSTTQQLRQVMEEGSLLVVGEPGAGKSGALHDVVRMLLDEGQDVIFLAVDHLTANSLGDLRPELGLHHNLVEILESWPGTRPGFLVIDALDAARADASARTFRDLIQLVAQGNSRWRVVASIRKFDLRYSQELRQLFSGELTTEKEFQDPEFVTIRHVNIPPLTEDELEQIQSQAPVLYAVMANAPTELRKLLYNPFNLRLMGELLGAGMSAVELTPIQTQLELLNKYWSWRVIRSDGQEDIREEVLRRVCKHMVEKRILKMERSAIFDSSAISHMHDLLSAEILSEWQPSPAVLPDRYIITFSHNVLFDYAVARLLLRVLPENLIIRFVEEPELVLVIRPSIVFHYRHLWTAESSHKQFWDLVLQVIAENKIPEIGKLIGPSVAAELATNLSDLELLCIAVEGENQATQAVAEPALGHLVGSLLALGSNERALAGPGAGPWCALLQRVSRDLRFRLAYIVRSLLSTLCGHREAFSSEELQDAGKSARRLLEFSWRQSPRDSWLIGISIQVVCRTFESEPVNSAGLLRLSLRPEHLATYGFEEIQWLAREVKRLIPIDPQFVEEIYKATFAYREPSGEPTPMGPSRIMSLVSNKQQDYDMALYELAEVFPDFMAHAPRGATAALIAVLEAYVAFRHAPTSGEVIEEPFDFNGKTARIRTDYNSIWDAGTTYRHEEPLKMLDAFQKFLENKNDDIGLVHEIVDVLVDKNNLAVLWRRLLLLGTQFPNTVGQAILPLVSALPILTCYDTKAASGEFLRIVFPSLSAPVREQIEGTILSIPDVVPANDPKTTEHWRDQLLGCLPAESLVTERAKNLLQLLRAANAVPPNEPPVRFEGWTSTPFGEEEYLATEDVPVEAEANRKLRELEQPVKEFASKHLNSTPTAEEVFQVFPALQELRSALIGADSDGVHPKQRDYAWDKLAAACGPIARMNDLSCDDEIGRFSLQVLLETSVHPAPEPDPQRDARFDDHPSWSSPAARIEAAEGLVSLARHMSCAGDELLQAIQRLSSDTVPAVRYQIAKNVQTLYRTAPEVMWQIIEHMAREEASRGVLQGLLAVPLGRLAGAHPDRITVLAREIFDRVKDGPGAKDVRGFCIDIFTGLYIWRDHSISREFVFGIVAEPTENPDEALQILRHIRQPLTHGPVSPPDPEKDGVRRRAIDLATRLLNTATECFRRIESVHQDQPFNTWSEEDQNRCRSLGRLIDHIGSEIYFASGAYDFKKQTPPNGDKLLTDEMKRFYIETEAILDDLANVGFPSLAHHLLETLEVLVPIDPRGVFLRIARVVRGGKKGGYQYETLAANLMVSLVSRYLAEYRTLLREDVECREVLFEILDTFVQAGWPSARRLTYRLEEIFR